MANKVALQHISLHWFPNTLKKYLINLNRASVRDLAAFDGEKVLISLLRAVDHITINYKLVVKEMINLYNKHETAIYLSVY